MDSYRPRTDDRRSHGGGDSYRPSRFDDRGGLPWPSRDHNGGMFEFKAGRERGFRDPFPDRSRPRHPPGRSGDLNRDRTRRPHHAPWPPRASERPLLRMKHDSVEDPSFLKDGTTVKFRALDELTDSEEEDMAQSDDEQQGPAKRTRIDRMNGEGAPAPKWSNPDPYTSLPPLQPGESAAKRTDVLRLIRKARLDSANTSKLSAESDDFISFDMDEQKSVGSIDFDMGNRTSLPARQDTGNTFAAGPSMATVAPPPTNSPPASKPAEKSDIALGKRKRGASTGDGASQKQTYPQGYADKWVLPKWVLPADEYAAPWFESLDQADSPVVALHKEILQFYDWVKPREYEERVRADVFQRLSQSFRSFASGQLKAFGSYAAGLYLPTGDMDLVFLTRNYRPDVVPSKAQVKPTLFQFASFLRTRDIAAPGSVVTIANAKVPIIKFVDRLSGLKVDLCFDNDSGYNANETFQQWKKDYPFMPIIVSIIKQYLMIRGLNDVSTGGLGGFSTICLVTSLIQLYPRLATMTTPNLGELLLEFFNLYGNVFDKDSVAIRLDPPGYVGKTSTPNAFGDKKGRLTIIDPNRPDNNISGGTSSIQRIFHSFSLAHEGLTRRLESFENLGQNDEPRSFLECLVGGNFAAYKSQRQILSDLYRASGYVQKAAPRAAAPPPPPPSPKPVAVPPPPPPPAANGSSTNKDITHSSSGNGVAESGKPLNKSQRRAKRLKTLRPDLQPSIGSTISQLDALKLGGYANKEDMHRDLVARERANQLLEAEKKK